jgi:hypothetical protein
MKWWMEPASSFLQEHELYSTLIVVGYYRMPMAAGVTGFGRKFDDCLQFATDFPLVQQQKCQQFTAFVPLTDTTFKQY